MERVAWIYHQKYHPYIRKDYMHSVTDEKTDIHIHPCVYSITRDGTIKLRYSSKVVDNDMFGVPKVMFGIWNASGKPIVDLEGKYGMCQHTMAITDKPEILPQIAEAMDSSKFRAMMKKVQFNNNEWDRNIIKLFRKDFWKEFV